jgi:hypothetical protein
MKNFIYVRKSDGFIQMKGMCTDLSEYPETSEHVVVELQEDLDIKNKIWNLTTSSLESVPPRPSATYDWTSTGWQDVSTAEQKWNEIKTTRQNLLNSSDWVVVKAAEKGQAVPEDVAVYRQALRDITNQINPFNIVWPVPPAILNFPVIAPPQETL